MWCLTSCFPSCFLTQWHKWWMVSKFTGTCGRYFLPRNKRQGSHRYELLAKLVACILTVIIMNDFCINSNKKLKIKWVLLFEKQFSSTSFMKLKTRLPSLIALKHMESFQGSCACKATKISKIRATYFYCWNQSLFQHTEKPGRLDGRRMTAVGELLQSVVLNSPFTSKPGRAISMN